MQLNGSKNRCNTPAVGTHVYTPSASIYVRSIEDKFRILQYTKSGVGVELHSPVQDHAISACLVSNSPHDASPDLGSTIIDNTVWYALSLKIGTFIDPDPQETRLRAEGKQQPTQYRLAY